MIAQSSTFYIDAAACHRNNYNRFIEVFDVEIKMVLNSPMPGDIRVVASFAGSDFASELKILKVSLILHVKYRKFSRKNSQLLRLWPLPGDFCNTSATWWGLSLIKFSKFSRGGQSELQRAEWSSAIVAIWLGDFEISFLCHECPYHRIFYIIR